MSNPCDLTFMSVLPPSYASVDSRVYLLRPRGNNDDEARQLAK